MSIKDFAGKVQWVVSRMLSTIGIDLYQRTDDRRVLENIIFPYINQNDEFHKILFVGCAWYTKGYKKRVSKKDYWTIEIVPENQKFGAFQHIVDSIENVGLYFKEGELDLIICNGVFGWGLDARESVENAFKGCHDLLRSGGVFILGWNDIPERRPFPLEECESLKLFKPYSFPPLSAPQYVTESENRHIFNFYIKN